MTRIEEIEAREKAALADEEYAVWKGNIEAIAEMQAGEWYSLKGGGFVLAQRKPGADPEMTTTIGIQLRLFATIDSLLAQLREARGKLEALENLPKGWHPYYEPTAGDEWWIEQLDRILHPQEAE